MKHVTIAALVGIAGLSLSAAGRGTGSGTYLEARTAEVFAGGCIMNSEAGTSGRQAVLAWKVDKGTFNGVTLDNGLHILIGAYRETLRLIAEVHATPVDAL